MEIYKLKSFARFAHAEKIADETLCEAVERATRGLFDADLGGGLIKQCVARKGQGRRGGFRVIFALRTEYFALFLFGFAKTAQDNLDGGQLNVLRASAASWLSADAARIKEAVELGEILEVVK